MYTAFPKVLNVFIYETMERNSVFFLFFFRFSQLLILCLGLGFLSGSEVYQIEYQGSVLSNN